MKKQITTDQNLQEIETLIRDEVSACEFWGNLDLSMDEFEVLGDCIRNFFTRTSANVELLWRP